MKSLRFTCFMVIFTSVLLIGFLGCNGGSSSSSNDNNTNNPGDENTTEQTTLYDDYKTLSDFAKATSVAKLKFMSVMSNGFEDSYGAVEPEAGYVAAYVDSHTRVLESLENVTAAVERINAAKKEPRADFAPASQVMFLNAASSAQNVMAADDDTGGKTEDSFLISAWDFLVNGLGGSAAQSRERVVDTLDQLSEEGRREAYEYARTARGIMNRDDVEDNAEDFWKSLKEGKYDNQCAVLYNDLTAPAAIGADIEFADVAERNSASGRADFDAVLEEGTDLVEKGKSFNPAIDGDALKGELENLAEKEMQQEAKKFQEHTEEHHYGDTDNAAESFAESVENAAKSGAFDPDSVKDLSDATKKAVDAIVPADDDGLPLDQGLLTVNDDSGQTEDGAIVIAEGEDTGGNPSVYISDMIGSDMTMTLPEGFWDVTAAGVDSVIDSISAEVQAGLETLATVDTSESGDDGNGDDEDDPANGDDEEPGDEPGDDDDIPAPAMDLSFEKSGEAGDLITYNVTAVVSGVTETTSVTISVQNASTSDSTKTISEDSTVSWSVLMTEKDAVVTVTRSDTGESKSITLAGKPAEVNYDGTYKGTAVTTFEGEDCYCIDSVTLMVTVSGSTLSGHVTGTLSGNQISGRMNKWEELIFTGTIDGNVMSGTWYDSEDGCCSGTFRLTKQ
ncbi:MAG: hypothetical protein ACLFNS_12775 [Desulfobacterales bacterium]